MARTSLRMRAHGKGETALTVAELIAELQDMPQDLPIELEGDCFTMALHTVTREAASKGRNGLGAHPERILLSE